MGFKIGLQQLLEVVLAQHVAQHMQHHGPFAIDRHTPQHIGIVKREIAFHLGLQAIAVAQADHVVHQSVATLEVADKAPGIPGSLAEDKGVMEPGSEKFTGIVGMSQWVTANTCARLGIGSMDYELVEPAVSEDEAAFCYPAFTPEHPSGWYLAKGVAKFGSWVPEGGFDYNKKPSVSFEELSKR